MRCSSCKNREKKRLSLPESPSEASQRVAKSLRAAEKRRTGAGGRRSLLLSLQLFKVELKLLALEDVSVETAALTWAGRDAGVKAARVELISDLLVNDAVLLALLELALDRAAPLGGFTCFIRFFNLLLVQLGVVLLEVPLSEGVGIDQHNGVLHESLRTHELVVGGVVNSVEHTSLGRHGLGAPREVAVVVPESAALDVSSAASDVDDLLGAELGHGGHSSHLELSLLLVDWHAATRGPPLVPRVPRNTHTS